MNISKTFNKHIFTTLVIFFLLLFSCTCRQKVVKPVWTAEVWWCHSLNFLCLSDSNLYFKAFISKNDSLKKIDFEKLNRDQKAKYTIIDDTSGVYEVKLCLNINNGEYVIFKDNCLGNNTLKTIIDSSKVFNPINPNKKEIEIIGDYKGFRISVEAKYYIWRTSNNKSFAFKIYNKGKLSSTIPINDFSSYYTTKTSIYLKWGPMYRKHYISKYNFDDLIPR